MYSFKSTLELNKLDIHDLSDSAKEKKVSASNIKLAEITLEGEPFWGMTLEIDNQQILIANQQVNKESETPAIFFHRSRIFVEHCIQELYAFGFFGISIVNGKLILDLPVDKLSSYYFHSLVDGQNKSDEDRILVLKELFLHELLFFQGVGPFDDNEDEGVYKEVVEWSNRHINGFNLKSFHFKYFFEPYWHDLITDNKIPKKISENFQKKYEEDKKGKSDKIFAKLNKELNKLTEEKMVVLSLLSKKYRSLITTLHCMQEEKNASYFSGVVTALNRLTIDNSLNDLVPYQPEGIDEEDLSELQVSHIEDSRNDFQKAIDFLKLYNEEVNQLIELAWQSETDSLEFKASFVRSIDTKQEDPELKWKLAQAITAMSNRIGKGGGKVVVGIHKDEKDDTPKFIGIDKDGCKKTAKGLANMDDWEINVWEYLESITDCKKVSRDFLSFEPIIYEDKTFVIIDVKATKELGIKPWNKKQPKGDPSATFETYHRVGPRSMKATASETTDIVTERR